MKLTVKERAIGEKSKVKEIRRDGDIPAILYAAGQAGETILVGGVEFGAAMRSVKPGMLPTTVFELAMNKKMIKAIIKDIQYHPTTYKVLHLDFQDLSGDSPIIVKVPVECVGMADCMGIKLGGFLRQVLRYVKVQCLPKDMPNAFTLDVKELGFRQSKRLRDLELPKGVRLVGNEDDVIAVIAKR
jgi:large subunit ribosomal protein L25